MPEINKNATFKITPEQFLEACSVIELQEWEVLLNSARYQDKIHRRKMIKISIPYLNIDPA